MAVEAASGAVEGAASGSSFYLAMRLLPRERREAMYAIYAFCRAVDDIADDVVRPRAERMEQLDEWRHGIESLYGDVPMPFVMFLRDAVLRYGHRKQDFLAVIDGMIMDVAENICAPEIAVLDRYCDRVASAVGRLSIKVFGMDEEPGFRLADSLGRALQLTNILRDLDEDAGLGRLYLPRELLERASVPIDSPRRALAAPNLEAVCRAVAGIARRHYRDADVILHSRPHGDVRPPRLMSAVYSAILGEMEYQGWSPPRRRVRVPKHRLVWMFLRHGLAA